MKLKEIHKNIQTLAQSAKRNIDLLINEEVNNINSLELPRILSIITGKSAAHCANKLRLIERDNPNIETEYLLKKFYQIV